MPVDVDALKSQLAQASTVRATGRVTEVTGLRLRFAMPGARIGDVVRVTRRGEPLACEVVGFEGGHAIAMPLGPLTGVGPHDDVESTGGPFVVVASSQLLGRVVDGLGRAIDGLLTLGEGQRIGLFAGSGVGKSTLLGAIARGADADVVVVALVGERGREVGEFLERSLAGAAGGVLAVVGGRGREFAELLELSLPAEARKKSVVVVATSDVAALERIRAAQVATAYAGHFRDEGDRGLF